MHEGDADYIQPPTEPDLALSPSSWTILVSGVLSAVLLGSLVFLPMPFSVMSPGPVFNTLGDVEGKPMISFGPGVTTYPDTSGELNFTTVSVTQAEADISLLDIVSRLVPGNSLVIPHDFLYPAGSSDESSQKQEAAELQSSQDASAVAALRATGRVVPQKVVVESVQKRAPADGVLKAGDVIVAVNGRPVSDAQGATDAISTTTPGSSVQMTILRAGVQQLVTVGTKAAPDDPKVARVGVAIRTDYDLPVDVHNNIGDRIGGPSAGTMFALSIYDQLTPGSLTGNLDIAGTGTITADGTVGEIGGVRQKMAGAERAGSTVFLLPVANCAEATKASTTMKLIPVKTLDEAIADLQTLAANHDAKVPQCPK